MHHLARGCLPAADPCLLLNAAVLPCIPSRSLHCPPPTPACRQANAGMGQASAQQQYGLTASEQLKAEGNRLHGTKQYGDAADKYRRAISNLAGEAGRTARCCRRRAGLAGVMVCFLCVT